MNRFSFFHAQVVQNLLTKNVKKAHTPCLYENRFINVISLTI